MKKQVRYRGGKRNTQLDWIYILVEGGNIGDFKTKLAFFYLIYRHKLIPKLFRIYVAVTVQSSLIYVLNSKDLEK